MKKEFDALISIVVKKKAELLSHVNSEYNYKLHKLHEAIRRSEDTLQRSEGLVEYSREAMKETNAISFLQASDCSITRLVEYCESCHMTGFATTFSSSQERRFFVFK